MDHELQPVTLEDIVISEPRLCEILGIERKVLDELRRGKDFPAVRLTTRSRVYLASDLLAWLEKHRTAL